MGTLHEDQHIFCTISCLFLLRMGNVSEKRVVEKIKTQILWAITFFFENVPFMR
jgi:hypothetical protein